MSVITQERRMSTWRCSQIHSKDCFGNQGNVLIGKQMQLDKRGVLIEPSMEDDSSVTFLVFQKRNAANSNSILRAEATSVEEPTMKGDRIDFKGTRIGYKQRVVRCILEPCMFLPGRWRWSQYNWFPVAWRNIQAKSKLPQHE
jgi:hypothetical protein